MLAETLALWTNRPPSSLSDHARECCRTARAWFRAMALSRPPGECEPTWIRRRYRWGPSPWPLFWCEAVSRETLDCGALMALALEAFRLRGTIALPVQLIEKVPLVWSGHFRATWKGAALSNAWVRDDFVYHEACALPEGGQVRVWDPTDASWRDPSAAGPPQVVAVRLGEVEGVTPAASVTWSGLEIRPGVWTTLESVTEEAKI